MQFNGDIEYQAICAAQRRRIGPSNLGLAVALEATLQMELAMGGLADLPDGAVKGVAVEMVRTRVALVTMARDAAALNVLLAAERFGSQLAVQRARAEQLERQRMLRMAAGARLADLEIQSLVHAQREAAIQVADMEATIRPFADQLLAALGGGQ